MAAEAVGYVTAISALGLVFAPLLARNPAIRPALQVVVSGYLLLLAWQLWRHGTGGRATCPVTARQVLTVTLLNPKAAVFALGVVPFAAPHPERYLAGFVVLMAGVSVGWLSVGATMGRVAVAFGRTQLVPRMGAAVIGGFALLLLASSVPR